MNEKILNLLHSFSKRLVLYNEDEPLIHIEECDFPSLAEAIEKMIKDSVEDPDDSSDGFDY